jgi:hypothetical protein
MFTPLFMIHGQVGVGQIQVSIFLRMMLTTT